MRAALLLPVDDAMARTKNTPSRRPAVNVCPMRRLIRRIATGIKSDVRFTESAAAALVEAAREHIVDLFGDAKEGTDLANRSVVTVKDMRLAIRFRRL